MSKIRAIALYLPQFHPIPENNEWWGPGFTEWTNVTKAQPLFRGHRQPHLPRDLGFYDLRVPEVREHQASLARDAGIEAFCYWHYWFGNGRRLLERPFDEVLKSGSPDFPFCLGWANESWTGRWHGLDDKILIEQTYPGPEDNAAHFRALLPAFRDRRYVTVEGRPVFHIYKPGHLPSASAFVDQWQTMARAAGLPGLYLVAGVGSVYNSFAADGFDGAFHSGIPTMQSQTPSLLQRARRKILRKPQIFEYAPTPLTSGTASQTEGKRFPCVLPNWDNTPRSGHRGVVVVGSTPSRFQLHAKAAIQSLELFPESERFLWIKSWNEWAEGNYLEPDMETGNARLDALRAVLVGDTR